MLNRRLVRVRAMQGLYALNKSKEANADLAGDLIEESFAPDLNSMIPQDKVRLAGMTRLALSYFNDELEGKLPLSRDEIPSEINSVLSKAREFLKQKNEKDTKFHIQQALNDAEKTYDAYLYILKLIVLLGEKDSSLLNGNRVVKALATSKELELHMIRRSVTWENDFNIVTRFYNEAVKSNERVNEYSQIINKTYEDDLAVIKYLVKNVILKHPVSSEFFEKIYLFWSEDTDILRTMVFHTFNEFVDTGEVTIEVLDEQWEDTRFFLKTLLEETANNEKEYLEHIKPYLKNWDMERIVETDLILLKMAVAEWLSFPSIPVKVTINEIIEISKKYSSGKSNVFINGVLDSVLKDFKAKNRIVKTGRGMLDNR